MNILKYDNYIFESLIFDLLLESKLTFSKRFIKLLSDIDDPIAKKVVKLSLKDIPIQHNYIDLNDTEKDSVSFTPDRKVKEIENSTERTEVYVVIDQNRYLTTSQANSQVFERLGFNRNGEVWCPPMGATGIIAGETHGSRGKIYVWFKGTGEFEGKEVIMNKEGIENSKETEISNKIWSTSRNNIKVGRLVRSILTSSGEIFTDRDIEIFVNHYKSAYDVMKNALLRFDIVEGDKIPYWYNQDRYAEREGVLGNSCMADVNSRYFDIYSHNPEVCKMIILYDSNGKLETGDLFTQGKYKSDKIIGRCLLWITPKYKIMDRIYTINDSDVDLFKEFGKQQGFWWKSCQDSDNYFQLENGSKSESDVLVYINLKLSEFHRYPYLDTFFFLNTDENVLTNDSDYPSNRELRSTSGGYDS